MNDPYALERARRRTLGVRIAVLVAVAALLVCAAALLTPAAEAAQPHHEWLGSSPGLPRAAR